MSVVSHQAAKLLSNSSPARGKPQNLRCMFASSIAAACSGSSSGSSFSSSFSNSFGSSFGSTKLHMLCRYFLGPGQTVPQILALGLSSRKNLCILPGVAGELSVSALRSCMQIPRPASCQHVAGLETFAQPNLAYSSVCLGGSRLHLNGQASSHHAFRNL